MHVCAVRTRFEGGARERAAYSAPSPVAMLEPGVTVASRASRDSSNGNGKSECALDTPPDIDKSLFSCSAAVWRPFDSATAFLGIIYTLALRTENMSKL